MFRACTLAAIMAAGLAVAACITDHAPTAPETGSAPSFAPNTAPQARALWSLAGTADSSPPSRRPAPRTSSPSV